jgi:hypothetical protein
VSKRTTSRYSSQKAPELPPLSELLPGGDQFLNCLRAREMPWSDPADEVCAPVEVLKHRGAHHREPALQFCQLLAREDLIGRSRAAGHNGAEYIRLMFARKGTWSARIWVPRTDRDGISGVYPHCTLPPWNSSKSQASSMIPMGL